MSRVAGVCAVRTSAVPRMIWGCTLLVMPRLVLRALHGRPSGLAQVTLRLLGARHLAQATATGLHPSSPVLTVGAGLDGVHAITAIALALIDRSQRRVALTDAGIAMAWIGLDLHAAGQAAARGTKGWAGRKAGPSIVGYG